MNLKTLALSSVLAVGGLFGAMAPAEAGTCWFDDNNNGTLTANYCSTSFRTNANGHRVVDIVDHVGNSSTLVFWSNSDYSRSGEVEIIGLTPSPILAQWEYDSDGDRRIFVGDWEMAIRF